MSRFLVATGAVVVFGVVIAVTFGAGALWVYAFFALLALATAVGTGVGGDLVRQWSSSRFDER